MENLEVFDNDIDLYLKMFCEEYNIPDLRKEPQSVWNACLMYIQKHVFSDRDKLKDKTQIDVVNGCMSSTYNRYNYRLLNNICDYYIYLCGLYNKEISINGFSKLTKINIGIIEEWGYNYSGSNRLSTESNDIYKKLMKEREESLSNKLADGKQNPVGVIAILNKHYGWNMPGVSREAAKPQALPASELPKLGDIAQNAKLLGEEKI